ncbi:MAG: hypothetical protein V8K32_08600 [Candidatus Electrothrix gigas]
MFALFLDCYAMGRHRDLPLHDHAFGGREMKSITEQDSIAHGKVEGCRVGVLCTQLSWQELIREYRGSALFHRRFPEHCVGQNVHQRRIR